MKKLIITVLAFYAICGFRTEPKLNVSLSLEQWKIVLGQIDNSNAPHTEVKATSGWIIEQLNQQLADSTKTKNK